MNNNNNKIRLTRRGRIVRDIVVFVVVAAITWWALDASTPEACKVPVEQMSHACKRLLFP